MSDEKVSIFMPNNPENTLKIKSMEDLARERLWEGAFMNALTGSADEQFVKGSAVSDIIKAAERIADAAVEKIYERRKQM
jgi:hypothetical protein